MLRASFFRCGHVSTKSAWAACALLLSASAARADAIDGDWCFMTQNLHISGPRIRTPGGNEMQGDYSRHTFNYVVPGNEAGAGTAIAMQLLNEEHMQLTRGANGAPEVWRRCKPVS
jgi:hypothetical protein